jgi:hypothetical protein
MPLKQTIVPRTQTEALNSCTVEKLRAIAKILSSSGTIPNKKADLVEFLIQNSFKPDFMKTFSDIELKALAETVHNTDGLLDISRIVAKYGDDPYKWQKSECTVDASLLDLYIIKNVMPMDVRDRLKEIIPAPQKSSISCMDELPETIIQSERYYENTVNISVDITEKQTEIAALQNLEIVLRLLESGKMKVSPVSKLPSGRTVELLSSQLCDGDLYPHPCYGGIQSFAWPLIIQAGGFAAVSNATLSITTKGKNVLCGKISMHDALKMAWDAWKSYALIDEFSRIDAIKGQKAKGRVMTSASTRRNIVIKALSLCPAGKWITIGELGRFMRAEDLYFDVAHDKWELYIVDRQYGSLGYDGHSNWEILQERYIKVLIMEYAATLGLVDIGYATPENVACNFNDLWGKDYLQYLSRYDGLLFFRVNNLGSYILGKNDKYDTPVVETHRIFDLLPNFDIIISDRAKLNKADFLYLNKIAESTGDLIWKITPKSIRAALEKGEELNHIREFISTRSKNEIPQTVDMLLKEAEKKVIDFTFEGRACLLECKNPDILNLVKHDYKLKTCAFVNDPSHIVLKIGKEKEFFGRLNDLGYSVPVALKIV